MVGVAPAHLRPAMAAEGHPPQHRVSSRCTTRTKRSPPRRPPRGAPPASSVSASTGTPSRCPSRASCSRASRSCSSSWASVRAPPADAPAVAGALVAFVLVLVVGIAVTGRSPACPRISSSTASACLLSTFGLFWLVEGLNAVASRRASRPVAWRRPRAAGHPVRVVRVRPAGDVAAQEHEVGGRERHRGVDRGDPAAARDRLPSRSACAGSRARRRTASSAGTA